jgi:hypothetical protein
LHGEFSALRRETVESSLAQILRRRLDEFRLLRRRNQAARNIEIGQRRIGLQALDGGIEGGAGDAQFARLRPGAGEEFLERGVGGVRWRRAGERQTNENRQGIPHGCHHSMRLRSSW